MCVCVSAVPVVHGADVLVVEGHRVSVKTKKKKIFGQRSEQTVKEADIK